MRPAGLEPQLRSVNRAGTKERRQQGSNLRTARRRLRGSNALPFLLGHASACGRRGIRTPKAREPTRFRDGIPRRWQSFRECDRPDRARDVRVSRALSYGHPD